VEEPKYTKGPSLEYFSILQEFEDVFQEIPGLPPKREIDLSIDLVSGYASVSKTPCRMTMPKLKELQIVITLNCTTHAYLASGQLISLLCQSNVEQLFENPLL
jgi:hypothetical protein